MLFLHHVPKELEGFRVILVLFKKLLDMGFAVSARLGISGIRFGVIWVVIRDN